MKNNFLKKPLQLVVTVCFTIGSTFVFAAPVKGIQKVANVYLNDTILDFQYSGDFKRATVNVTGPSSFRAKMYKKTGSPSIDLSQFGTLDDGLYRYQISVATSKTIKAPKNGLNNGRGKNAHPTQTVSAVQSGHFRIKNGSIIIPSKDIKEK